MQVVRAISLLLMTLLMSPQALAEPVFTAETVVETFFSLHHRAGNLPALESHFSTDAYRVVAEERSGKRAYLEYSDPDEFLFVIVEQTKISDLASNEEYSVSLYEVDQSFADELIDLVGAKLNRTDVREIDYSEGWNSAGWVFEEGNPTISIAVAYNPEYQVAQIWGHTLLMGDE
ncbi:MAG: hypothetical protein RDA78_04000 [Roseibium sp.]|uniref:hypothetical protein n=1 Tax=Roseibium sp. TaxID=1936156 RepID=UPI003D9C6236